MSLVNLSASHCINPNCARPYPQPWGNKFCNSCGASLQLIERYVPLQRLGSGGFAQIYTVWDQKTQTEKVLKVLVEASLKARELFAQEAAVLSSLRHPSVPRVNADGYFVIDLGNPNPDQLPCLVMEKIHGHTLEEVFQQYPQGCPQESVLHWFTSTVEILQELHKRKILHRDIKPSNLMLRSPLGTQNSGGWGDRLVLIDFGGAKQFSSKFFRSQSSSTRLYSSGYSPPEQIAGGNVGPATDFYALGRTMIEMLTGQSFLKLEDPLTGELHWRKHVNVHPELADLLDEMVQENVRSRPANAAIIKKRLAKISQPSLLELSIKFLSDLEKTFRQALVDFTQATGNSILFVLTTIFKIFLACLDTIWTMLLTGVGAVFGTVSGFVLANHLNLDQRVLEIFFGQIPSVLPNTQGFLASEILLFAGAGLGTAWGLVIAGGFGQRRQFVVASFMGVIGYGIGCLVLQITTPKSAVDGLVGLILAAVSLLTLGLGLRSHHIVHAVIAAFGTAIIFSGLITLGLPTNLFQFLSPLHWGDLWLPVTFFGFLGVFLSFWLGVSYYLIVPGLRFLGWR